MSILFYLDGNCQVLKVLDSTTNTTLTNINFDKQDYILSFSTNGNLKFKKESIGKKITISHLGYISKTFYIPKNDTTICLSENIIRLGEITIKNNSSKSFVIGNYQKKSNNVFVNSKTDKDIRFTVVNKFNNNQEHIEAILFYIAKDENYVKSKDIGSLEVVFFKETVNKLPDREPFHKISVNNYSVGWNKVRITDLAQQDDVVYYGIKWVFNPDKYHYKNVRKKKTYNFFGPKLGVVSNNNTDFHQTYFFNTEKGWRPISLTPAMLALEISK